MKNKTIFDRLLSSGHSNRKADYGSREFVAEQLESRVLYSGAPVCLPITEIAHEATAPVVASHFESIDSFVEAAQRPTSIETSTTVTEMTTWTDFDSAIGQEPIGLTPAEVNRWEDSGIIFEAAGARQIEYQIVKLEADYFGNSGSYEVEIDSKTAQKGVFVDTSRFDSEEFGVQEGLAALRETEAPDVYGMELLAEITEAKVLGLDQIRSTMSKFVFTGTLV